MIHFYMPVNDISDTITKSLGVYVVKALEKVVSELTDKNNKALGSESLGFRVANKFYLVRKPIGRFSQYDLPELHGSLHTDYADYIDYEDELNNSLKKLNQFLRSVLLTANDEYDELYRQAQFSEDTSGVPFDLDLGRVLPHYLLAGTALRFSEKYEENPKLKSRWEKIKPEINKLVALKTIVA